MASQQSRTINYSASATGLHGCSFDLDFERPITCLKSLANLRDALPFPRTAGKAR